MAIIRLYIDEDAMHGAFILGLKARNVDVVTATDATMINREDDDHLMAATGLGRALYSYNGCDYQRLHGEWLAAGRSHAGIILAAQQRYSVGEEIRRIIRLISQVSTEQMRDRVEYLGHWG